MAAFTCTACETTPDDRCRGADGSAISLAASYLRPDAIALSARPRPADRGAEPGPRGTHPGDRLRHRAQPDPHRARLSGRRMLRHRRVERDAGDRAPLDRERGPG